MWQVIKTSSNLSLIIIETATGMKLAQNVRSSFSPAVSTNAAISAVLSLEEGKTKLKRMFYQHLLETSTESLNKDGSEVGVEVFFNRQPFCYLPSVIELGRVPKGFVSHSDIASIHSWLVGTRLCLWGSTYVNNLINTWTSKATRRVLWCQK